MDEYIGESRVLEPGSIFPYIVGATEICSPKFGWLKIFEDKMILDYLDPSKIWIPEYHYTFYLLHILRRFSMVPNSMKIFSKIFSVCKINEIEIRWEFVGEHRVQKIYGYSENYDIIFAEDLGDITVLSLESCGFRRRFGNYYAIYRMKK